MNVLVLPSWYPSPGAPLLGSFIAEQAQALADLRPDLRVIVSTWGHSDGIVPLGDPARVARAVRWRANHLRPQRTSSGRLSELLTPTLLWSGRLPGGGTPRLLKANRRNWAWAERLFGPIDLVHAHVGHPAALIAAELCREKGVPWVLTEHMGPFPFPELLVDGRINAPLLAAYRQATALVAVSPALADAMVAYGLPQPEVVPNLVDERVFVPGAQPPAVPFVFFTLASLHPVKGLDVLLRAIAAWNPPVGQVEFRIGGAGPEEGRLRALAQELGVSNRVRWLGAIPRSEAPAAYQRCHAFVLPSRTETFGIVLAEALATGKPVIATRCGGPESIVRPEDGELVAVEDVGGLSGALQRMHAGAARYDATALRAGVVSRFGRPAVTSQLADLYERVSRAYRAR